MFSEISSKKPTLLCSRVNEVPNSIGGTLHLGQGPRGPPSQNLILLSSGQHLSPSDIESLVCTSTALVLESSKPARSHHHHGVTHKCKSQVSNYSDATDTEHRQPCPVGSHRDSS